MSIQPIDPNLDVAAEDMLCMEAFKNLMTKVMTPEERSQCLEYIKTHSVRVAQAHAAKQAVNALLPTPAVVKPAGNPFERWLKG